MRTANVAIAVSSVALFLLGFWAVRGQAAIGNEQFLRSMIPHHSGAILMCEQAPISDPKIVALCGEIVRSQCEEIAQMRSLLERR